MSRPTAWSKTANSEPVDYAKAPFIAIWEVTRACQLHCLHCRAQAQRRRDPRELTTEEGKRLIEQIAALNQPLLVLTGGDPFERDDLAELVRHGNECGLSVSITPSATPKVTREAISRLREAGVMRFAFSLDGADAAVHDRFRGASGSFEQTLRALDILRELRIPIQLNTTVCRHNVGDLERIAELAVQYQVVLWSLFFLVPTGRARAQDMLSAEECERVLVWAWELSQRVPFAVKTTEAPHYRRVALQYVRQSQCMVGGDTAVDPLRAQRPVADGDGFVFISHIGEVCPSGFLPLPAGNVRERPLAAIYQASPLFRSLRDRSLLKGKCGICEFRDLCGGSRARAYAVSGDYLASDPACAYQPGARQLP